MRFGSVGDPGEDRDGSAISAVDFGYNFDTIVNTNDAGSGVFEGERLTALTGKERGFEYPGSWPQAYLDSTSRSGFFENG